MKALLNGLAGRTSDLVQTQPVIALALGVAFLALFLSRWRATGVERPNNSLAWTLCSQGARIALCALFVALVMHACAVMRSALRKTVATFQQSHGRITEANYNAVQTIWGSEQAQRELSFTVFFEEEVVQRTEFEDPAKPALLRRTTVRRTVPGNPFLSASHRVVLRQNPRKKGSALYGGYETECAFSWKLKSPADRPTRGTLRFPLPAHGGMYDALTATLNGEDILPQMELSDAALVLTRDLAPREELTVAISFASRGMSQWYFQVPEQREIRDFTLALTLPDIRRDKLNYPEGCMSPTEITSTNDGAGSVLKYRLDHAISHKGMGIALPSLPQPGATTSAVLCEAERGWMLAVAALLLALTLSGARHGALISVAFAAALTLAFALLGDFSDLLFGFWATAAVVFAPIVLGLAWAARKIIGDRAGIVCAGLLLVYALAYPVAAGLDAERDGLYLHVCAFLYLLFAAWLWTRRETGPRAAAI